MICPTSLNTSARVELDAAAQNETPFVALVARKRRRRAGRSSRGEGVVVVHRQVQQCKESHCEAIPAVFRLRKHPGKR